MIKGVALGFLAATLIFGGGTATSAKSHRAPAASRAALADGGYVLPPITFTKFCLDYPSECAGGSARVHMDAPRMQALEQVNREVNGSIAPARNTTRFHFWKLNVAEGDCNNYAIQKRHELIQRGWPAGALSLSVVKTSWGEGHLVVTVRTDAGDYVLDNLRSSVVSWNSAGYRWLMRQSSSNPQYWVALNGGRPAATPVADDEMVASAAQDEPVAAPKAPAPAPVVETQPVAPAGAVRSGRGMVLGMADESAFMPPLSVVEATLTLKQSASELALLSAPVSFDDLTWSGDAPLLLSDSDTVQYWTLRGALDDAPEA